MGNSKKYNIRHFGRNIWILVMVLILVFLLSLSILSGLLGGYSKSDKNIIPINTDNVSLGINDDDELMPDMLVEDKDVSWETNTSVDLFREFYTNDDGMITVSSEDGEKVIAPGTSNQYEFSIKNNGSIPLEYVLNLDSMFSIDEYDLPFEVRLRKGDEWLIGDDNSWADRSELERLEDKDTVDVNNSVLYVFEWQWPYEAEAQDEIALRDLNDTLLGNMAISQDVEFRLNIRVESTIDPSYVPNKDKNDNSHLLPLIFLGLAILVGLKLIWIVFWRTPIYVTGFVPGMVGNQLKIGRKKSDILSDGRFIFKRIYVGKHKLYLGDNEQPYKLKLKRKSKLEGIEFKKEKELFTILIGRKVQAIELYTLPLAEALCIREDDWAAIDSKCNVITPLGVRKPDDNGFNVTPGGLSVDKHKNLKIIDKTGN